MSSFLWGLLILGGLIGLPIVWLLARTFFEQLVRDRLNAAWERKIDREAKALGLVLEQARTWRGEVSGCRVRVSLDLEGLELRYAVSLPEKLPFKLHIPSHAQNGDDDIHGAFRGAFASAGETHVSVVPLGDKRVVTDLGQEEAIREFLASEVGRGLTGFTHHSADAWVDGASLGDMDQLLGSPSPSGAALGGVRRAVDLLCKVRQALATREVG